MIWDSVTKTRFAEPTDGALLYDQYWSIDATAERVIFHRCYDPQYGCDDPEQQSQYRYNPGARVSLLTDADRVRVMVEYGTSCRAECPGTPPDHCYRPKPGHGFMRGTCTNHCAIKLYMNGVPRPLPSQSRRADFDAPRTEALLLFEPLGGGAQLPRTLRKVEIVMPWGGEVAIKGFELQRADGALPSLKRPESRPFRFVAYGDSITQGFCAPTPYPEVIGRLNGWNAINLGIGGLKLEPRHGESIGRGRADLVLMFLGTNEWWRACDVTSGTSATIAKIRAGDPSVPLVLVTMLVRADEPERNRCIVLEDFRRQIRAEVARRRAAGDARLYLIEGKPLLALERLGDGLHPGGDDAMAELGSNLNAQMGFSKVQYTARCAASSLRVEARGLTPRGTSYLFWGEGPLQNRILQAPCQARSVMVGERATADSLVRATADSEGRASFAASIELGCPEVIFQIVDVLSCVVSRVGRGNDTSSTADTAAESFLPPSPPPPPSPTPQAPPQAPPRPRAPEQPAPLRSSPPTSLAALPRPSASQEQPALVPLQSPPPLPSLRPTLPRMPLPPPPADEKSQVSYFIMDAATPSTTAPSARPAPSLLPASISTAFQLGDRSLMAVAVLVGALVAALIALMVAFACRRMLRWRLQLSRPPSYKFQAVSSKPSKRSRSRAPASTPTCRVVSSEPSS